MRTAGMFNGTGATVYLCIGFVPDYVTCHNLEGTQIIRLDWNRGMRRAAEVVDGVIYTAADVQAAACTVGTGISPYYGKGKVLTSDDVGTTTYAEGVYLKRDDWDYRYVSTEKSPGDGATVTIDTWTLDTASAFTGHFNGDVTGTYIGEGSEIIIDGRRYSILALTASQGVSADEVTLDMAAPSGVVEYIGGMYDYKPMVAGEVAKDGFKIINTTLNVNNALIWFEAGTYDR
uniref:Uncharacterized protein n=1 Tax=viral metagenome TaxID=1070528 RepID=A0A6M3KH77_9ZZZZ